MTTGDGKYIVGFIGIGKMGFPMASRIAADLAKSLGSKTLLGETLLKSWADAEAKLGGAADHPEIFRLLGR